MNKNYCWRLILILLMTGVLSLFLIPQTGGAEPLDNWHWRNPLPQGNPLNSAAYGNGTFVAVGDGGTVVTSTDGTTWTPQNSATTVNLHSVAFGNGTFVAVGDNADPHTLPWPPGNAKIVTSTNNGASWTTWDSGSANFWIDSVTFGNGQFVAVGFAQMTGPTPRAVSLTSTDGSSWSIYEIDVGVSVIDHLMGVAYGNGVFLAVGQNGRILRWTGFQGFWTSLTSGTASDLNGITFGNGTFVAVGYSGRILTSGNNGDNWTDHTYVTGYQLFGVASNATGEFVAVGAGAILTSIDGNTWTTASTSFSPFGVTYGNGMFVAVGTYGDILTSADGTTWTARSSRIAASFALTAVIYGNGEFLGVDIGSNILTSSDGTTWTVGNSGTGVSLFAVAYGNGTSVAVGYPGLITSTDGVTWTANMTPPGVYCTLYGASYGNGTFVAVGCYGIIITSPDGVTWTQRTSGFNPYLVAVTYGNGTFVAVGDGGTIRTSSDGGTNWTNGTYGSSNLTAVTYGNGTFVAVGEGGTILTSTNGTTWTAQSSGTTSNLYAVTYGNGTFVAVGDPGTIITSTNNGVSWTPRNSGTPNVLLGVAYGNKSFVAIGEYAAILQSDPVAITITASAGAGGSISPSGDVTVNIGDTPTFTFTPDPYFMVQDIIVDGVSQGGSPPLALSYTFPSVNTNHTISVSFALSTTPDPNVGGGTSNISWPFITATFTYTGPTIYLVPPDGCYNVVLISDPPLPQNCRRRPPYILTVSEEAPGSGLGIPGGDWVLVNPPGTTSTSWTISCNLLEIFDEAALQAAGNIKIIPMYTFFDTDRGLDANGNCVNAAQGDICVDIAKYPLFQGTIVADQVGATLKEVQIDIKPGTYPNTINLGSNGVVPVAILSSPGFDPKTVKPESVMLGGAHVKLTGKGTPIFSYADVNGDGKPDLIVNVLTDALELSPGDTEAVLVGVTTDGISIIGKDTVRIVPAQ